MPIPPPAILQVFNRYLDKGGEETGVGQFAEILRSRCRFGECTFESADWKGRAAPPQWKQIVWMFHNPESIRRLRAAQAQSQSDVWLVHNIFPVASPAVYDEALRQKIPIVQFIHNFRPFSITGYLDSDQAARARHWPGTFLREIREGAWQKSRLKTLILGGVITSIHLRNQLRAIKAWVGVSEFMRSKFIGAGLPAEKVFRLYPPRERVNAEANFPEENYYLFMGRLIEDKGVKVAVESWNLLRNRLGNNAPRLIITGGGPLQEWVKGAAGSNPLIEYRGFVPEDEKHRLLANCRAVIQPSIWAEPLSIVIYDAFDYGKPVLAAGSGGMPELVNERTGLVHQKGNVAQLASQVEELDRLPRAARQDMGREGRKWLLANTGVDYWAEQLFEIMRQAQRGG